MQKTFRICFLCGCLEPGRDGVGDYTRSLALACAARGWEVMAISLNDPHVAAESLALEEGSCQFLRLRSSLELTLRLSSALRAVRTFRPDWVSWQFVAYSYHPKGVPPKALIAFAEQLSAHGVHLMAHELWLGLASGEPLKNYLYGIVQRRNCERVFNALRPRVVHTSNEAYLQVLRRGNFNAEVLPLFGSIPSGAASLEDCRLALDSIFPPVKNSGHDRPLVALTFGALHSEWRCGRTAAWFSALASRLRRPARLVITGRAGPYGAEVQKTFDSFGIETVVTGDQTPAALSRLFTACDFGIAPHPWALIGKSASTRALLEHGLPVLVPREDWQLRGGQVNGEDLSPLLAKFSALQTAWETDRWMAAKQPPNAMLPQIVDQFLGSLSAARNGGGTRGSHRN